MCVYVSIPHVFLVSRRPEEVLEPLELQRVESLHMGAENGSQVL